MAAGENPEYTMEYILDVLGQIQSQCVALMDDIRTGKDTGNNSLKVTTYSVIDNVVVGELSCHVNPDVT